MTNMCINSDYLRSDDEEQQQLELLERNQKIWAQEKENNKKESSHSMSCQQGIKNLKGWDSEHRKLGSDEELRCRVCNVMMDVKRGFISKNKAGVEEAYDKYTCPHRDKDWHIKALHLCLEMRDTASKRLKKMLEQDLDDILL